jgi:hypothetical protein
MSEFSLKLIEQFEIPPTRQYLIVPVCAADRGPTAHINSKVACG